MSGLKKVFLFTLKNQFRSRGFLTGTIVVGLLLFLIPALLIPMLLSGSSEPDMSGYDMSVPAEESVVEEPEELQPIDTVYIVGGTDEAFVKTLIEEGLPSFPDAAIVRAGKEEAVEKASAQDHSLILLIEEDSSTVQIHSILPEGTALTDTTAGTAAFEAVNAFKAYEQAGRDAQEEAEETSVSVIAIILPMLNVFLIYFLVLFYGQSVARCVIMEKTSKLMDFFLVTVKPREMIFGKVLGVCLSAAIQFMIWVAALVGGIFAGLFLLRQSDPGAAMGVSALLSLLGASSSGLNFASLIPGVLLILAGFVLYSSLSAIGGALAGKPEDLSVTNVYFTVILVVSYLATLYGGVMNGSAGVGVKVFDLIPFTAVMVTPARMLLGQVSTGAGFLSLLLVLVLSVLLFAAAGKVYQMMSLYKGNPPKPGQIRKMLKESR